MKIASSQRFFLPCSIYDVCFLLAKEPLLNKQNLNLNQDDEGIFMANMVVHPEGGENQVHESEDVVRDILRMDQKTYEGMLKE